jgi:DNA-binding MarR family transcriptional regulator
VPTAVTFRRLPRQALETYLTIDTPFDCAGAAKIESLGIARNILSNRLSRLVEAGILKREHCADDRRRIEYRLTPKGYDLLPAMLALRQWGEKWEMNAPANPVLCDARDGLPIAPIAIRAHDGRVLDGADLTWREWRDVEAAAALKLAKNAG